MKLFIITPVAYSFWNYPTYSLLAIVALLFIVQVIGELMKPKTSTNQSYEEIKELFKEVDDIVSKDIYSDEEKEIHVDIKCEALQRREVLCTPPNFSDWTYNQLSTQVRLMGLKPTSRKKTVLIESLEGLCT